MQRIQGQCARSLYKLASLSTPQQFRFFVPALSTLRDAHTVLSSSHNWTFAVEAAQAASFLVVANQPHQIDVLMEHRIFDDMVQTFQDNKKQTALRWHASIFIWSVAQHCDDAQMRKLSRLMGILGKVFHLDNAHPHLRAAALNILQVMLLRGEYIVQQFVYHRDSIPANAMDLVRSHSHKLLVHGSRDSNCIVKYASYTLTNATIGANSEQLIRLLELGVYPLLFKIISFDGEVDKPEEAKLKAVAALSHLLQQVPNDIKNWDFSSNWDLVRALIDERYDLEDDDEPTAEGELMWSEELRERAQELLDMAHEVDLL